MRSECCSLTERSGDYPIKPGAAAQLSAGNTHHRKKRKGAKEMTRRASNGKPSASAAILKLAAVDASMNMQMTNFSKRCAG